MGRVLVVFDGPPETEPVVDVNAGRPQIENATTASIGAP